MISGLIPSVAAVLEALVALGGAGSRYQIRAYSGYDSEHCTAMLRALGWIETPHVGMFVITERGKIALAIDMGRKSRAVTEGRIRPHMEALTPKCQGWWNNGRFPVRRGGRPRKAVSCG